MKYRFFILASLAVALSACGGSKTTDQPVADSVAVQSAPVDSVPNVSVPENSGIYYKNERFRFSVTVPSDFVAQPDPENGDGRSFKRNGATIIAYASHCGSFDEVLAFGGSSTDTYVTHKDNWAVWSGVEDGLVYYKKTVFNDGKAYSVYFQYPESEKQEFDGIIKSVLDSWQTGLPRE